MYKLPSSLSEDIQRFGILAKSYLNKEIESIHFKSFRVSMGVYEQRKNGVYMLRIRMTGGVIYPNQFLKLINIALRHCSNLLHITTRQELQIQNLDLHEIEAMLYELKEIGLTTKGTGGNTIRNILVSYNSGITDDEIFDTTSYAMELTTKLMAESDSYLLPRKMKIAFSSNDKQIDYAAVNDLGFVAKIKEKEKGFAIYVGGGGGSNPSIGWLIFDFIPENELFIIVEAIKKMFFEHGDKKNKSKARIRYIFYKLGETETIRLIKQYYEIAKKEISLYFPKKQQKEKLSVSYIKSINIDIELNKDYEIWKTRYTIKQKQIGYVAVLVPFLLGNIVFKNKKIIEALKSLLYFVSQFGEDTIRFTTTQNIQLRNIPDIALPELYFLIKNMLPNIQEPLLINNIICCTGSDTCRLGICMSKGLADAIRNKFKNTKEKWDMLANVRIHISGCPNSCSQQFWADIGFSGKVLKNNKVYPGYSVYLSSNRSNNPRLAELIGTIAARYIPEYVVCLLVSYLRVQTKYKNFSFYLENDGREKAIQLLTNYQEVPSFEDDESYYLDWGVNTLFNNKNRKKSECSAGLFDMINIDLNYINRTKKRLETEINKQKINKYLYNIIYTSLHMLLITKGIEPKTTKDMLNLFFQYFIANGLIKNKYNNLIKRVMDNKQSNLLIYKKDIYSFYDSILELHRNINSELFVEKQQKIVDCQARIQDLRGIVCPMNFVQIKMHLASMQSGEKLEIWIDDGPSISNVPKSLLNDGHQVLEKIFIENYWKVLIKKK